MNTYLGITLQHNGPWDQLFNVLESFRENITTKRVVVSLVIDTEVPEALGLQRYLKAYDKDVGFHFVYSFNERNRGLTYSRNLAAKQLLEYPIPGGRVSNIMFGFTNSILVGRIHDELVDEIDIFNRGLMIFPFRIKDPLFDRNHIVNLYPTTSIEHFLAVEDRPDYLMVCRTETYVPDKEFEGEKYCPEDEAWYKMANNKPIAVKNKELFISWFNPSGMTMSTLKDPRSMERANQQGYYSRAEFFIDKYLNEGFPLTLRKLKDFTSTLVSSHNVIPFKKYKGTLIETLLLERIKSWAGNKDNDNEFKMTKG